MKYFLVALCCMVSLKAMDELPADPTPEYLHGQAIKSAIGSTVPFNLL